MNLRAYQFVFRVPGARSMILGTVSARIFYSTVLVALVATGELLADSYLLGGGAGAIAVGTMALSALPKGRLLDRLGPRWLLAIEVLLSCLALLLAITMYRLDTSPYIILLLAFLIGCADPSTVAIARNAWWRKLEKEQERISSMALEEILAGVSLGAGAAIAGGVVVYLGAWFALLFSLAATIIPPAILATNSLLKSWETDRAGREPWKIKRLLPLGFISTCLFAASGTFPVLFLAASQESGQPQALPILLAAVYPGVMISGLLYGSMKKQKPERVIPLLLAIGVSMLMLAAAPGSLLALGTGLLLYGFCRGPVPPALYFLAFQTVGDRSGGQATGFLVASMFIGLAIGNAVAGALLESMGVRISLFLPAAFCLLALFVSLKPKLLTRLP